MMNAWIPFIIRTICRNISLRIGLALLWRLPQGLVSCETTVPYMGVRVCLNTGEDLGKRIFYQNNYEKTQLNAFISLLQPGDKIFDVGSNYGIYSLIAAKKGIHSWAFEPSKRMRAYLRKNIDTNGFQDRITPVNEAVTQKKEQIPFHEGREGNWGVGRIFQFGNSGGDIHMVQGNTLDHYCRIFEKPNLIKIDIEGAELYALRGADETLSGDKSPKLLLEFHPGEIEHLGGSVKECMDKISSHGYRKYKIKDTAEENHSWFLFAKHPPDEKYFEEVK